MKRARGSGSLSALKRAQLASVKFSKGLAWKDYGAARMKRGTPENLALFGETYRKASDEQKARRKDMRYTGRGLYTGGGSYLKRAWDASAGLRSQLGGAARSGQFGAWGQAAGYASKALGWGDYTVTNSIVSGAQPSGAGGDVIPSFRSGDNTVVISHKEYITDLFGPAGAGTFQNTVYSINPGVERTFPWLSQVAANYEEYTLRQCIFTFRSTITDFVASNGQVGQVIMATQYNPSDAPFATKQDAMEYDMAMSGKTSCNMLHGVECDPSKLSGSAGKFVRSGPVRSDDDLKSYDWGNLNLCVSNIPSQFANQALGEVWVSYTIELRKPKFFVSRGLNILRDAFIGKADPPAGAAIDVTEYAYAQQNRIGGALDNEKFPAITLPVTPTLVKYGQTAYTLENFVGNVIFKKYTFPAGFSGNVAVRFAGTIGTGQTASAIIITSGNAPAFSPINDIWHEGGWQNSIVSEAANSGDTASTEVHLTVRSPTTAVGIPASTTEPAVFDNVLYFAVLSTLATGPNAGEQNLTSWSFDVSVYNTGFNYPSSGNMIVMNPITDLQEQWP